VKLRWKWVLAAAAVALLAATAFLATSAFGAKNDARRRSADTLDKARDGASRALLELVAETGANLETARPEAPGPLAFVTIESGPVVLPPEAVPAPAKEVWFVLGQSGLNVWRKIGADQYAYARVPVLALERLVLASEGVGAPAAKTWRRLAFVDREGGPLLSFEKTDEEDQADVLPGVPKKKTRNRVVEGERRLRAGDPSRRDADGMPAAYTGEDDQLALASWAPVEGTGGRLWTLVEVRDADVASGVGGFKLPFQRETGGGHELMPWHLTLALALLCLVAFFFLWLPSRGGKQDVGVLLRTYRYARPYKWGILAGVLAGAAFGGVVAWRAMLARDFANDVLFSGASDERRIAAIWKIVWFTVALGVVQAVTNYVKEYLQNYYSTAMMADIRLDIARKVITLPLSFFNRIRAGDLVSRIERDVSGLRQVLNQVFEKAFVQPFTMVASIVIAFMMNWKLALVLFGLPLIVVPVFRIAKRVKKRATKRQVLLADMSHVLFQMLSGVKVVKAFHGEEREVSRLNAANRRFIHEARRIARLMALSASLLDFLQMCGGAVVVGVGGYYVLHGEVNAGDLIGFLAVLSLIYGSAKDITQVMNKLVDSLPAVQRVFEIFDTESDLVDGPRQAPPGPLKHGIELRGVRFKYKDSEILKGVDLFVPAGKVVAVVGPTGAGKTTLCDVVARFYDPTEGEVLWDGVNVREYSTGSVIAKLAVVTQDAFLFNAPLDENIRYGREEATQAEVEAAARDANVHDEILLMDGGYEKTAGERGMALSGGQRQRVTIARALIKDAPVLILDEATSNLDSHSEKRVQQALARLMKGRTTIVVAHRLSTIRNADKVVVVDDGRIVEEGAPDELLRRPGSRFKAMYDLQGGRPPEDDEGTGAPVA
jgi:subfamily B ATP-binding cassette protein MsbA